MEIGIVGLPNVGKSTLFNALLKKQVALAANYPFATIEPNVGVVPVVDERLTEIGRVANSQKIVYSTVKFVDIAGLVKGASTGEGLGNKFLTHIREVDAICFVLRDFSDENIIRSGSENPQSDFEVLETELIMADLQTVEKSKEPLAKRIAESLTKAIPVRDMQFSDEEQMVVKQLSLLTNKAILRVYNVDEDKLAGEGIRISAKMEEELAGLSEAEQKEYLVGLGRDKSGLEKLVLEAQSVLGLQTFLTAGEMEARAWTIKKGTKAPQAAGVIHNDFEKHFIKADCLGWREFVELGGWPACRQAGKVRQEGRDYVMQDGDVVEFKVGV